MVACNLPPVEFHWTRNTNLIESFQSDLPVWVYSRSRARLASAEMFSLTIPVEKWNISRGIKPEIKEKRGAKRPETWRIAWAGLAPGDSVKVSKNPHKNWRRKNRKTAQNPTILFVGSLNTEPIPINLTCIGLNGQKTKLVGQFQTKTLTLLI